MNITHTFDGPNGEKHVLSISNTQEGVVFRLFGADETQPLGKHVVKPGVMAARVLCGWLTAPPSAPLQQLAPMPRK